MASSRTAERLSHSSLGPSASALFLGFWQQHFLEPSGSCGVMEGGGYRGTALQGSQPRREKGTGLLGCLR